MISLFRGPGGVGRRCAAEIVPLGCGFVAVTLYAPLGWTLPRGFALAAGGLTGFLTWIAVSVLLRAVRRRPVLRRVYRVALLLHVLFWSTQGVLATANDGAGPVEQAGASAWREPVPFLAGVGDVPFDLPARTTLAGWGAKPRRITMPPLGSVGALGRLGRRWMASPLDDGAPTVPLFRRPDPAVPAEVLGARAVVLRPEAAEDGPPVAFIRVDLVTSDRKLTAAVAESLTDLGFRPEGVLLAATHTHSGPGGYSDVPMSGVIGTDHFDAEVFRAVRDACVAAVRRAHEAARPARIALVKARDRRPDGRRLLCRNRRKQDPDAIDDRVYAVRLDERDGDATIAVLLNYAVHPVLLRRRHMGFHRDLAGALEDAVAAHVPGSPPVLFFNGAQGDVTSERLPVKGAVGAKRGRLLAERFVETSFAPAWSASTGGLRAKLQLRTARTRRRMATPRLLKGWGSRTAVVDALYAPSWESAPGDIAAGLIALPVNVFIWSQGVPDVRFGFSFDGAVGFSVNLEPGVGTAPYEVGAMVFDTSGSGNGDDERWALLWQPGEATQDVGRGWRAAVADIGIEDCLLVGIAGGSAAYVTTEDEFHAGGYEAVASLYGPGATAHVTEALVEALLAAGEAR
ncbi:MAG: neutral/alkaline non-lysosomal ceramidase N-terminal domain-containing protein [Planctomycetota bacterium]|nr:neutral/alkaline non-lysosomal ceramidase N-terminal domain-containing protein [Planctomycetota bacterium]